MVGRISLFKLFLQVFCRRDIHRSVFTQGRPQTFKSLFLFKVKTSSFDLICFHISRYVFRSDVVRTAIVSRVFTVTKRISRSSDGKVAYIWHIRMSCIELCLVFVVVVRIVLVASWRSLHLLVSSLTIAFVPISIVVGVLIVIVRPTIVIARSHALAVVDAVTIRVLRTSLLVLILVVVIVLNLVLLVWSHLVALLTRPEVSLMVWGDCILLESLLMSLIVGIASTEFIHRCNLSRHHLILSILVQNRRLLLNHSDHVRCVGLLSYEQPTMQASP